MKTACVLLVVCALVHQCVVINAGHGGKGGGKSAVYESCKSNLQQMCEIAKELPCTKEMGVPEYGCTEEEMKEAGKKMKAWFQSLDENQRNQAKDCKKKWFNAVTEAPTEQVSQGCKDKLREMESRFGQH